MAKHGLFVGLVTLDLIYLADAPPIANQKIVAQDTTIAAGGPATNAAIAFQQLGNSATLMGAIGSHPICHLIQSDLQSCGVQIVDLAPAKTELPPVSSIVVTKSTGDRSVVSINAVRSQIDPDRISPDILDNIDVVLIDGHQMAIGARLAKMADDRSIPVVIDAGSWKPGFETVLPWVNYAICSASFHPPTDQTVFEYLRSFGIPHMAITHGKNAIELPNHKINVPQVPVVDTLGAGDIFHGAFCHYILMCDFHTALSKAAQIAAYSCQFFGTREWRKYQTYNNEAD
ncbi:sugar kinase [Leptolyngbya sp. FACHB-17]|uniref:sugar kinase n=1 Tax=unclassified Leptolyngbya TaxID=2650499 RepID=UPI001681A0C5|nr:sugar kinase [Leptolyngbya sp. FACHB-17]MBD2083033.1 sugar kinase [Leptolyngbya sp. FACHB-17]